MNKECLECGMVNTIPTLEITDWNHGDRCLKCDALIILQTDGSTHTVDIAHNNETVTDAVQKFDRHLEQSINDYTQRLRVICGGGLIKEEMLALLFYYQEQQRILSYSVDEKNRGVIMVTIRR